MGGERFSSGPFLGDSLQHGEEKLASLNAGEGDGSYFCRRPRIWYNPYPSNESCPHGSCRLFSSRASRHTHKACTGCGLYGFCLCLFVPKRHGPSINGVPDGPNFYFIVTFPDTSLLFIDITVSFSRLDVLFTCSGRHWRQLHLAV